VDFFASPCEISSDVHYRNDIDNGEVVHQERQPNPSKQKAVQEANDHKGNSFGEGS